MNNEQLLNALQTLSIAVEAVRRLAKSQINAFDPAWRYNEDAERRLKEVDELLFGLRKDLESSEDIAPPLKEANVMQAEGGPLPPSESPIEFIERRFVTADGFLIWSEQFKNYLSQKLGGNGA